MIMTIILWLVALYLLALVIGCTILTIGYIIEGTIKLIALILTTLVNLFK
jgi:hypothetical protein